MKIEGRLKELGIALPKVGSAMGTYVHAKRVGDLLYLSGKGPLYPDGKMPKGKLGAGMSVEEGYRHARQVGLVLIAAMKEALGGELDRVTDVIKVLGMVNAAAGLRGPPQGDQRLLRPLRRGLRRARAPRALGRRHELAAGGHPRRDRGDRRGRVRLT